MPPAITVSITRQDSVANFNGGTTKQLEFETNGRARHAASDPATIWSMSSPICARSGEVKEVPTCLVVPETEA